jgi:kinesin family member 2/24
MGNNESNPIRNMDKRTARREYRVTFMKTISSYRRRKIELPPECTDVSQPLRDLNWVIENDQNIRVCVRKRPIFKHEVEDFEFDVVSAIGGRVAVVHDGRMHSDMRRHFMDHHKFAFDNIFDEKTNNEEVYTCAVAPLAKYATVERGYCTCLVYGQTGSGKTFTMSSMYTQAAEDVFHQLNEASNRFDAPAIVSVSFIELAGENCFDLLNAFTPAQLLAGVDGSVHAYPIVEPEVSSAEELAAMIAHGFGVRSTGENTLIASCDS